MTSIEGDNLAGDGNDGDDGRDGNINNMTSSGSIDSMRVNATAAGWASAASCLQPVSLALRVWM